VCTAKPADDSSPNFRRWLIAEFGIYYADHDWDKVDTATHMIAHVIQSQQLGGCAERTFPAAINGHRVEQVAFTEFVLHTAGESEVIAPFRRCLMNKLAHTAFDVRKGQHHPLQKYSKRGHQVALHGS
jgi:hypothetical protein